MKGQGAYRWSGFSSLSEYVSGIKALPMILKTRSFSPLLPADPVVESGAAMKRVLGAFDLACMGVGMMLGAGVFVTTGYVAANIAGPGVIISYLAAGICALLSSFCYSEFAVDIPYAGGAYTYVAAALGEFMAWLTVTNLIFEYILANAAAVRGFSPYFAALTNKAETFYIHFWTAPNGTLFQLDWWAFGWCILLSMLLIFGTKESSLVNTVVTVIHVVLVVFIIVAGLVKAKASNAHPFLPWGPRGAFNGASIVYFSYIGFDAVATAAEETKNPKKDLPLGILGSVLAVTVLYALMAATLVMMVPVDDLLHFSNASFAAAFDYVGWKWATYIVAMGALLGIVTTTLIGMYGTSRIITGVARDHLIPPFLGSVSGRFKTPAIAITIQGIVSAVLALLSPFSELADMVSISTLFAFWVVSLGLMWRRSCTSGEGSTACAVQEALDDAKTVDPDEPAPRAGVWQPGPEPGAMTRRRLLVAFLLFMINAGALVFTLGWKVTEEGSMAEAIMLAVGGGVFLLFTGIFHALIKPMYIPPRYQVPLYPWLPSLSMAFNIFLLGQLGELAYERFGIWTAVTIATYFMYSAASSWNKAQRDSSKLPLAVPATQLTVGEVQMK